MATITKGATGVAGPEPFIIDRPGATLVGERWGRSGPLVVALHAGVADRRSWWDAASLLAADVTLITYDRRGFGQTPPTGSPFTHVDDVLAVLDHAADEPAWLAGTSAGGGVALDTAIVAPQRVAGLLLLAPGITGAPMPALDPATAHLARLIDEAEGAGNLTEVNRLVMRLWLDGLSQPEGRVGDATRALALEMNQIALENKVPEGEGASGVDAWSRATEVAVPAIVGHGEFDAVFVAQRCQELAGRMRGATLELIHGTAHLPELERPDAVAGLLLGLTTRR